MKYGENPTSSVSGFLLGGSSQFVSGFHNHGDRKSPLVGLPTPSLHGLSLHGLYTGVIRSLRIRSSWEPILQVSRVMMPAWMSQEVSIWLVSGL